MHTNPLLLVTRRARGAGAAFLMITRRLVACTPAVFWSRARDSSLHTAASPAAVLFIAVNLTRIPLAVHTLLLHFSCAQTLPWILVVNLAS